LSKNYRLIGLTGPTGSGKSSVSQIFADSGFGYVDADKIAHKALLDKECIDKLLNAFSSDILNSDNSINRKALAKIAFQTKENTKLLNSITHPVILRLCLAKFEELSSKGYADILLDAPTLFEAGMENMCDLIISVISPKNLRFQRILKRDNLTEDQANSRINAQHDDSFYTDRSDYVILNDCDLSTLSTRTKEIIKEIL